MAVTGVVKKGKTMTANKKIAQLLFAVGIVFGGATLSSQSFADNLYGGIGLNYSRLDAGISPNGANFDDRAKGGSLFLGYESLFSTSSSMSFAIEGSADLFVNFRTSRATAKLRGATLISKLILPVSKTGVVRLFGEGGAFFWRNQITEKVGPPGAVTTFRQKNDGVDPMFGLGVDVRVAPGVRLLLDHRYVDFSDAELQITSLRGLYYF